MDATYRLKITFLDGKTEEFIGVPVEGGKAQRAVKMREIFKQNMLALEVDGSLLVVPTSSIRTVEITPSEGPYSEGVIRNLKRVNR